MKAKIRYILQPLLACYSFNMERQSRSDTGSWLLIIVMCADAASVCGSAYRDVYRRAQIEDGSAYSRSRCGYETFFTLKSVASTGL